MSFIAKSRLARAAFAAQADDVFVGARCRSAAEHAKPIAAAAAPNAAAPLIIFLRMDTQNTWRTRFIPATRSVSQNKNTLPVGRLRRRQTFVIQNHVRVARLLGARLPRETQVPHAIL